MKNTIEAEDGFFIGVAEYQDYCICEIDWWERDSGGSERRVKLWDVPVDIRIKIRKKLVEDLDRIQRDSAQPDPMDLAHQKMED